jgi:hypothetical protein
MTSATAATSPSESKSTGSERRGPRSRTVVIHLAVLQILWLAAIAFAIYLAATT